jgi:hypothetical protein
MRRAEEAKRLEEARKRAEEEQRKLEEARRIEAARKAEEARIAEEARRKVEEARRQAEAVRLAEEARKAEMERRAQEARVAAKSEPVADSSRKPAPPPMVSSKKSVRSSEQFETRTSEKIRYKEKDGEYEVYEEYIPLKGKEEVEVVPADFGRLTYTDFDEDDGFDDNFVFNDFEEEQEDDGDFNYGVKVVRKRKIGEEPKVESKAPVQAIVLTDENEPEVLPDIDGKKMMSLADMRKNQNKRRF